MRSFCLLASAFLMATLSPHAFGKRLTRVEQKRIVAIVERVPANLVEPGLPATQLATWLRQTLGSGASIQWDISDCDLMPDFSKPVETYPLCVGVRARTASQVWMTLHFEIGTLGNHDPTHPSLARQSFVVRGDILNGCIGGLVRLSTLRKQIDRLSSMPGCDKPLPRH
jgi:hypothetical protein